MKIKRFHSFLAGLLILSFSGCLENELPVEIDYNKISRIVGPEGGTINFYQNALPQDKPFQADLIASFEIPVGALDEEVILRINNLDPRSGPEWSFDPPLSFNKPVILSYKTQVLDSNLVDAYCFYSPRRTYTADNSEFVQDYSFDLAENLVTVEVNDLEGTFGYSSTIELSNETFSREYFFCQSTNEDVIEISLENYGDVATNNLLLIPRNALVPPAYLEVIRDIEFSSRDNIFDKTEYVPVDNEPLYLLPTQNRNLYNINPVELSLNTPADVYLELADQFPINIDNMLPFMKMYSLNPETRAVIDSFPVTRYSDNSKIINSKVDKGGVHALGIKKSDFALWKGGKVTLEASNADTQFSVTFESSTVGGMDISCISDYESCILKVHLNQTDNEIDDFSHYTSFQFFYDYGLDYMELDAFEYRVFYFTMNNEEKEVILYSYSDFNHVLTKFENETGGQVSGSFQARGFDEMGVKYDIKVTYDLKVISAYTGSL